MEPEISLCDALSMKNSTMVNYVDSTEVFADIDILSKFGTVNLTTCSFDLLICPSCKCANLGRKDREENCKKKVESGEI